MKHACDKLCIRFSGITEVGNNFGAVHTLVFLGSSILILASGKGLLQVPAAV